MTQRDPPLYTASQHELAVLAYGSLLSDPGPEIEEATSHRIDDLSTPFNVEYARSSGTRGGAPTLVPVDAGGRVLAAALIMKDGVDLAEARNRTYRRETDRVGTDVEYVHHASPRKDHVWLPTTDQIEGVLLAIYTVLDANIPPTQRTAECLARLAIQSVAQAKPGRDGITYLQQNLANGIITPLSKAYEAAILQMTGAESLVGARLLSGGEALAHD